jgi:glycopeptide antibiotics resistance protein
VWKTWRWEGGILSAYIFLVLAETIFIRQPFIGQHFQPELFWSWRVWNVQRGQIIANVIMFVPVGVLSGLLWKWKGVFVAAGLSLGIEILQLVTSRGLCELDDVFHNVIGAVIGVGVVMIGRKLFKGEAE